MVTKTENNSKIKFMRMIVMRKLKGISIVLLIIMLFSTLCSCVSTQIKESHQFCEIERNKNRFDVNDVTIQFVYRWSNLRNYIGKTLKMRIVIHSHVTDKLKTTTKSIVYKEFSVFIDEDFYDNFEVDVTIPKEMFLSKKGKIVIEAQHNYGKFDTVYSLERGGTATMYYKLRKDKVRLSDKQFCEDIIMDFLK